MAIFRTAETRETRSGNGFTSFTDIIGSNQSHSGTSVTQENATNLPAVYRCVSLNVDTVATLPVDAMTRHGGNRKPASEPFWLGDLGPNDHQDWGQFIGMAQASLELDGNAFILKASNAAGAPIALYVLAPNSVRVSKEKERIIYWAATDKGPKPYASTAILHIRGLTLPGTERGLSPVAAARQTIGLGLAAERYGAQFFGSGATLSGVVTTPGSLTPEMAQNLQEQFQRKHGGISKSHAIGVLSGGASWTPLSVKPEESQFLETRKYTDVQIAHMYGTPPEYVTDTSGASGYVSGLYARQYMWLQTGINPRLVRLERALSTLLPRGTYIKFNRNAFLAMEPTDRANFYSAGLRDRWLTPNEVRELEDMNDLKGGDDPLWSVQWNGAGTTPPDNGGP